MSAEPKRVELTAYSPGQCCTDYCIPEIGMHDEYEETAKTAIAFVAAREAAARREALLEVREAVQRRMDGAELADGGKLSQWDALASVAEWIEEKA